MAAKKREEQSSGDALFCSLPAKRQLFVLDYLANGGNATQAAKSAGYSDRTADSQGSRLLKDVKVAAVLAARVKTALTKREITAERVLDELAKMAFFDPRKLFDGKGDLIPVHQLGDDEASSIAGLDVSEILQDGCSIGRLKKIKLTDRRGSLELLGRHLKLFTETVEHKGTVGVELVTSVPRPERPAKGVKTTKDEE